MKWIEGDTYSKNAMQFRECFCRWFWRSCLIIWTESLLEILEDNICFQFCHFHISNYFGLNLKTTPATPIDKVKTTEIQQIKWPNVWAYLKDEQAKK